jgi:hypothetical protein
VLWNNIDEADLSMVLSRISSSNLIEAVLARVDGDEVVLGAGTVEGSKVRSALLTRFPYYISGTISELC